MSQLTEQLKALATPDMLRAAATSLGENEFAVGKAMHGAMPIILSALLDAPSQHHTQLTTLLNTAGADNNLSAKVLQGLGSTDLSSDALNTGSALSELIFGGKQASVANQLSNFAGIKSSSSTALLNAGGALAASLIGHKMIAEKLSFNSILAWLGQHKGDLSAILPGSLATNTSPASPNNTKPGIEAVSSVNSQGAAPRNKYLFPLLLLALIGLGLVWWMNGCNQTSDESTREASAAIDSAGASIDDAVNKAAATIDSAVTVAPEAGSGTLDSAGNWIITKGEPVKIKLDNGVEISAFKGSLEDRFHAFIKDPSAIAGKDIWFNFEDMLFESNKATLKKGYEAQLSNTVEMLKAYPALKIKLGAYTDNTGDSLKNVKLSESRARAVYNLLISKGAPKASFDEKPYEGYGPLHPVTENTTAEGRAQNRRVSLSVREK